MCRFVILLFSLLVFNFSYAGVLDDLLNKSEPKKFYSFEYDAVKHSASLRVYSRFSQANNYVDLFEAIRRLPVGTKITLYTGGYGGDIDTVVSLLSVLAPHRPNITVIILSPAYSSHAFLACAGSKFVVHPGALMMFHGIQFGGNPTKLVKQLSNKAILGEVMRAYCTKLLTEDEIKLIEKTGEEVYITPEDMRKRVGR